MAVKKKFKEIIPIKNLTLVDKVEQRLIEFFKENKLVPGDSIPKELDFAGSLGVSRTVVREALLRLRTLGLIESRKHRGMILTRPDIIGNFKRILDPVLLSNDTLKDLFELRLILEMGMSELLFARKTQKDLDDLEEIVVQEEETKTITKSFILEKEILFHGKLYKISNNETLQRFQVLLLPVFEFVHEQPSWSIEKMREPTKLVTHRNLLDNLKIGTPETFRIAMRNHLDPHFNSILNS